MRIDRRELGAVFVGGFLGTVARAEVAEALPFHPGRWPWATFAVNIAGALLLGWAVTRLQERLPLSAYRRPFLGTGVCGGLTTFSAMQVELVQMLDGRHYGLAAGYALASIAARMLAVALASNLVPPGGRRTAAAPGRGRIWREAGCRGWPPRPRGAPWGARCDPRRPQAPHLPGRARPRRRRVRGRRPGRPLRPPWPAHLDRPARRA